MAASTFFAWATTSLTARSWPSPRIMPMWLWMCRAGTPMTTVGNAWAWMWMAPPSVAPPSMADS